MLTIATIALFAATSPGPTLWGDITAGMSVEDVRARYPAVRGKVHHKPTFTRVEGAQPVGKCKPVVEIYHENGVVSQVYVSSRPAGFPASECGEAAADALLAKYGAPLQQSDKRESGMGYRVVERTWLKDGVTVKFKWDGADTDGSWSIRYEVVPDRGL